MRKIKHKKYILSMLSILFISLILTSCIFKPHRENKNIEKIDFKSYEKEKNFKDKKNKLYKDENLSLDSKTFKNNFDNLKTTSENINIPILCYHDVTQNNPNNNELLLSPDKFREQLKYLKDNNYTPITLNDLYSYLEKEKPLPIKPVVITFDDGYIGNYDYAYPILKEFNYRATIFVISNFIGAPNFMTADQIKEVSNNFIDIESHTSKHDDLSSLDEESQFKTLKDSKIYLEKLIEKPVDFVAYPFGRYNPKTRIAAKNAGYKLGFNLDGDFADRSDNYFNIDRIYVSNNYSLQKFKMRLEGR